MTAHPFVGLTTEQVETRFRQGQSNRKSRHDQLQYAQIVFENVFTLFNAIVVPAAIALLILHDLRGAIAVSGMAIVKCALTSMLFIGGLMIVVDLMKIADSSDWHGVAWVLRGQVDLVTSVTVAKQHVTADSKPAPQTCRRTRNRDIAMREEWAEPDEWLRAFRRDWLAGWRLGTSKISVGPPRLGTSERSQSSPKCEPFCEGDQWSKELQVWRQHGEALVA